MGRVPCCDKANVKRGPWSPDEDAALRSYVEKHHGTVSNWIAMPQKAGLRRCGKSCRLRWLNYLRPDIKHGCFTEEEDNIICTLYNNIGSRWSVIASNLPGRTDNDVKNYWNTKLKKKLLLGIPNNSFPSSNPTSAQVLPPPAAPACTPIPRVLKTDQSAHTPPHHLTAVPLDSGFGLISKEYSYPFAVSESSRGFVSPPSSVSTSVENWSASGTSYNSSTSHDAFLWELLGIGSFGELLGEFAPIYSSSTTHGTNAQGFCHNVTNYS